MVKSLSELKNPKETSISIITPPSVTQKVVQEALDLGIMNIWLQPGSEDPAAVKKAEEAGANIIAFGPCLLRDGKSHL